MEFSAAQIADWIDGEVLGNENTAVSKLSKIEEADKDSITFLSDLRYADFLPTTQAGIVIINKEFPFDQKEAITYIKVADAYGAFTKLLTVYDKYKNNKEGVADKAQISDSATLGQGCYIGDFSFIGDNVKIGNGCKIYPQTYIGDNTVIGDNTTIFSGVKIYHDSVLGNQCTIHSNTIIGSDGFGFLPDKTTGEFTKIPQIGNVVIKDKVEVGSACTIDRATMGSTIIEFGVKLDNQIQIAHNVIIGKNTGIASQTGIAGSTKIGENCMIGGQVGIAGHLTIGNFVQIQAQSGVNTNIKDGEKVYGSPAMEASSFRKSYVYFRKLPRLVARLEQLEKKFKANK